MNEKDTEVIDSKIPMADMIQKLRQELVRAQAQATDEKILFGLEKVELELKVVTTTSGKGHTGVEFWVVNAGGDYEKKGETSHTIKLTLSARDNQSGDRINLSNKSTDKFSDS
jgi:L-lactate utilization protein LutB